jgi:hypothetical protein
MYSSVQDRGADPGQALAAHGQAQARAADDDAHVAVPRTAIAH